MSPRENYKPENSERVAKQRLAYYLRHPEQAIPYAIYRKKWLKSDDCNLKGSSR